MAAFGTAIKVTLGIGTGLVILATPFLLAAGVHVAKEAKEKEIARAADEERWAETDRMEREQREREQRERDSRGSKYVDVPSTPS